MSAVARDVIGAHEPIAVHRELIPMLWPAERGFHWRATPQTYSRVQRMQLVAQLVESVICLHATVAGEPAKPPFGLPRTTARTAPHSRASRSPFLNSSQLHAAALTR